MELELERSRQWKDGGCRKSGGSRRVEKMKMIFYLESRTKNRTETETESETNVVVTQALCRPPTIADIATDIATNSIHFALHQHCTIPLY